MCLIVQKFGGSSVKDAACIARVAKIIAKTYNEGNDVLVVLSAQGDTTDELIEKARQVTDCAPAREMDMLLSTGEQVSVALCAMALEKLGVPAVSLNGYQAGIVTDGVFANARIQTINTTRIRAELAQRKVVLVTGFQGVSPDGDITTLGRGGSDTSAVALAAALGAKECRIYTDVDGVYTADPRIVPNARKLDTAGMDEMLALASQGAQVLHDRSVELAKTHDVELDVLSSIEERGGTRIGSTVQIEKRSVTGITRNMALTRFDIRTCSMAANFTRRVFALLAASGARLDAVWQYERAEDGQRLCLTVPTIDAPALTRELSRCAEELSLRTVSKDEDAATVSIVGADVMSDAGVLHETMKALEAEDIAVHGIETGALRIALLIERGETERALRAIHKRLFAA